MSKRYDPSPVQLCLALDVPPPLRSAYPEFNPARHASLKVSDACEMGAVRFGQDQYRCAKCALVWDIDEPRPPCQGWATDSTDKGETP